MQHCLSAHAEPRSHGAINYRPDIDGLRAIAVLSVVLYHAGLPGFPGGYVGVDVFFVISGYLITSIIDRGLKKGSFSIFDFYERRVRRIFPALFAMCAVVTVFAAVILTPVDFKEHGESLLATSVFGSNIYFYLKSGYFDASAEYRPLLHTWSLAVEEQYYLFFPLMMVAIQRLMTAWKATICLSIWLLSLAVSIYLVATNATGAFYLITSRTWELFTGSLVALGMVPRLRSALATRAASWLGLAAILAPIFLYSPATPFPGLAALPPVLGAAAVIHAGSNRLLAARPVVAVGLISYSLYLWHWPVFVFGRYLLERPFTLAESVGLVGLGLLLGYASWRYVEPMRNWSVPRTAIFAAAGLCILVGVAFGIVARVGKGLPSRLPSAVARVANVGMDINPQRKACSDRRPAQIDADEVCRIGNRDASPSFVLVGDSFGDALSPGVAAAATGAGSSGYILTHGGCVPLADVDQVKAKACRQFMAAALRFVHRHPELRSVLVIGRWTTASEGTRFGLNVDRDMFITDAKSARPGYSENRAVMRRGLDALLAQLAGRQVTIVAHVPEQRVDVPRVMAVDTLLHRPRDVSVERAVFDRRQSFTHSLLAELQRVHRFAIVDVGAALCNPSRCPAADNGIPLYVDDNHLSATSAIQLRPLFAVAVR